MFANWAAVFLESQTCQHHQTNFILSWSFLQRSTSWKDVHPAATSVLPRYAILYQVQKNNTSTSECFQHEILCWRRCGICYFYYFLLKPVRSGKRWEVKSSSPFRGKINHYVEFSYSLLRHVGRTSIGNRLWCETTAGSFMALIWMQFIPADGVRWEGKVALPEWLVRATDASLCCWV